VRLTATGFSAVASPDYAEARRALAVLVAPGQTFELRALPFGRSSVCRSTQDALRAIEEFQHAAGVYFTLNPCRADLDGTAKDRDIISRRWLLVDLDPVRPKDASSTDEEKNDAKMLAEVMVRALAAEGWPSPVIIDSGNGYHLLYRVDLPADKLARQYCKNTLKALAERFDTPTVKVDRAVHNEARISKLPGTWARKGHDDDDRPHRMARLLYVPEVPTCVTAEQLAALAGPVHLAEPEPARLKLKATSSGGADAYCRAALQGECAAVALAPEGDRNNVLNVAAFKLGTLLHYGIVARNEAEASLSHAARRAGLSDREIAITVKSGLDAGLAEPRDIPERDGAKAAKVEPKPIPDGKRLFIRASEITPKKVEFLWPGRVPLGKMTTFAGQGGLGKTLVLCDMAARVSMGAEWPLSAGECAERGNVLFISGEDDEDDTLVPRLIEAGADLERVLFLSAEAQDSFTLAALELLTRTIEEVKDVRLVVIDPPASYLGDIDDHKNAEVRSLLTPIKRWASLHRVAVIFNTHVNKAIGQNAEAAGRVMGSVAWVNAVRAAHMFIKDADDQDMVLFAPIKINIARRPKGMTYRIVEGDIGPKVEWLSEVDKSADDALNRDRKKPKQISTGEWFAELFHDQREISADVFWRSAKEHGIDRRAVAEFRHREGWPKPRKTTGQDGSIIWTWFLPPGVEPVWVPPEST
jgi:hypothetical protein